MDITQTYIKMCEKAYPDISDVETINIDFGYIPRLWAIKNSPHKAKQYNLFAQKAKPEGDFFQVYFQDQLQEMLVDKPAYSTPYGQLVGIDKFMAEKAFSWESMEQLWLAFVLHEKYHKKLDGEKWK